MPSPSRARAIKSMIFLEAVATRAHTGSGAPCDLAVIEMLSEQQIITKRYYSN